MPGMIVAPQAGAVEIGASVLEQGGDKTARRNRCGRPPRLLHRCTLLSDHHLGRRPRAVALGRTSIFPSWLCATTMLPWA